MTQVKKLTTPLTKHDVSCLRAGDRVEITGTIYTSRDMAHKRLCESLEKGEHLPFKLEGAVIYFVGPTPPRPPRPIGAAGPTTSSRMDLFSPKLLENGLKAMIGKGYRGPQVRQALQKCHGVHLSAIGGAGALLSRHIASAKIIAYEDLGTEAVRELQVVAFPATVAYDSYGDTVLKEWQR